ncbi:hypothetical protein FRC04_001304 [Tulasnella sp. 424]|nr:hypothetical protein FRC04_001304 [Tulasnella sp. 424]KAG8966766.1 hypothetical protein FRC05_002402 [Tulasnella sp. 425]
MEAWAIDAPTHGDAGTLNEEILQKDYPVTLPFDAYARTISHFLTAGGELESPGVNFANRKLVGLGHCLGAAAAVYFQNEPSFPIKFQGMVLVEVLAEPPGTVCPWEIAITGAYLRRDTWSSRDDAFNDLRKDPAYGLWSDKSLEVFVQHGLKDHPAANYDPLPWKGVSTKCTRTQEVATYRGMRDIARLVPDLLPVISRKVPVHCIWAAINPRIYKAIQNAVETQCDVQFASVQKVPKAGHLVIQHNPEAAAQAVLNALKAIWHGSNLRSRL